jgi:hypothetical protein
MSGRRDDPANGRNPSLPASRPRDRDGGEAVSALGQSVAGRLFTAGLELHFALRLIGEGPAAQRCAAALDEVDRAITQVRHLALAAQEHAVDGHQLPIGTAFRPATRGGYG